MGNQNNPVGVRLLSARWQLRVVILDYPRIGKVCMPDIDGIGMGCHRLMCVNFSSVLMPVAAMLVRTRQMGVRSSPLHRHENGQQDKIGRGAKSLFDQGNNQAWKIGLIVS